MGGYTFYRFFLLFNISTEKNVMQNLMYILSLDLFRYDPCSWETRKLFMLFFVRVPINSYHKASMKYKRLYRGFVFVF